MQQCRAKDITLPQILRDQLVQHAADQLRIVFAHQVWPTDIVLGRVVLHVRYGGYG